MASVDYDECFDFVKTLSLEAGVMIKDAFKLEKKCDTKSCFADLVTETDQAVEKYVISSLKEKFPSHGFIGEESYAAGMKAELTDDPTWIIDPIDGTTNFVHRFPHCCISIGFYVNQEAQIGLIYNPITNEMYTARKGQGAFCNGEKLQVNDTKDLSKALVCAEAGSSRDPDILDKKLRTMKNVAGKCHGLRLVGSCALHMCYVASGIADCHYSNGIHVWDIAAGVIIVREAGGFVSDVRGSEIDLMNRNVLCAATKELALELSKNIEKVDYERD